MTVSNFSWFSLFRTRFEIDFGWSGSDPDLAGPARLVRNFSKSPVYSERNNMLKCKLGSVKKNLQVNAPFHSLPEAHRRWRDRHLEWLLVEGPSINCNIRWNGECYGGPKKRRSLKINLNCKYLICYGIWIVASKFFLSK